MSYYDNVQEVVKEFMFGAKRYANVKRTTSGDRKWDWIDNEDFLGVKYHRPFFRTVEGYDHTMFVIDVDTRVPEFITNRLSIEEEREIRLRAVLIFIDEWLHEHSEYKFTTYVSGTGLYLVQRTDEQIDKRRLTKVVWSPSIDDVGNYNKDIEDKGLFKACVKSLKDKEHTCTSKCEGWHRAGLKEVAKFVNYLGIEVRLIIDLHMYTQSGDRLFRAPYSPYFKYKRPFYCVPLEYKEDNINIDTTIRKSYKTSMDLKQIIIHPFQFNDRIGDEVEFEEKYERDTKWYKRLTPIEMDVYKSIDIPDTREELTYEQKRLIKRMTAIFSNNAKTCPPCIYNHFDGKTDAFWSKMVVVRYLANRGYDVGEIALFIRFVINDEEDNRPENRNKLFQHLPNAYGRPDNPNRPPRCWKMQETQGQFSGAITPKDCLRCGRTHPLQDIIHKKKELDKKEIIRKAEEIKTMPFFKKEAEKERLFDKKTTKLIKEMVKEDKEGFKKIRAILKEVLESKKHSELIKTTRCGVTTTLIHLVKEKKKRALVIAPTNAIGYKTFPEALGFAHRLYGLDIDGAILANNTNSCLKLQIDTKNLFKKKRDNPDWGENGVRFNDMAFHFKPPCISDSKDNTVFCKFYEDIFEFPHRENGVPIPIGSSEVLELGKNYTESCGLCAYNTIMNNIANYDVLFMTYDKLNAVLAEGSDESKDLMNYILNEVEILFFDEISFLAQKPKLIIPLINESIEGITEEFIENVKSEIMNMQSIYEYEFIDESIKIVNTFINHVELMVSDLVFNESLKQSFSYRVINPLSEEEKAYTRKYFGAFHSLLENYAKEENIYLENLEKFLVLMQENYFYLSNYQTLDFNFICSITCSPIVSSIRKFTREFSVLYDKQILVTDATMPYIKMSDLLGIDFERVIVGDPRETNKYQLIVADSKKLPIVTLVNSTKTKFGSRNYMQLYQYINDVCKNHNPKDIMIVVPNSGIIYRKINDAQRKEMIPKGLQITYYRSDKTIGVATTRRIMIAICTPYPPRFSHIWLANYYKDIGLYSDQTIEELSEKLENMNAFQTFYQTIGRVKDPANRINSIVYLYGIRKKDVEKLLGAEKEVPKPKIISLPSKGEKGIYLNMVSTMWQNQRRVISEPTLQTFNYIKRKNEKTYLSRVFNDLKFNEEQIKKVLNTDREMLNYMGLIVSKTNRGTYTLELMKDVADEYKV